MKSRYRTYWYGMVLQAVKRFPEIERDDSVMSNILTVAVYKTLREMEKLPDGHLRVRAVRMIYFDKSHTEEGVAMALNVSRATVQRWLNYFIRSVGKYAGFWAG